MRKVFFSKLVNITKELLHNAQTILHYLKDVKTALKNLFPLWNNGKKKVKNKRSKGYVLITHSYVTLKKIKL